MRISSAFPSDYLKAADVAQPLTVTMTQVKMVTIGDDERPALYFKGLEKALILNKTNSKKIAGMFGDDTDQWAGQEIVLYETMVPFQGNEVAAIRIKPVPRKSSVTHDPMKDVMSGKKPDLNDDIPF